MADAEELALIEISKKLKEINLGYSTQLENQKQTFDAIRSDLNNHFTDLKNMIAELRPCDFIPHEQPTTQTPASSATFTAVHNSPITPMTPSPPSKPPDPPDISISGECGDDQVSVDKELAFVVLDQEEDRTKIIADEKLSPPLRQNIEHLEGKHSQQLEFKSHVNFSSQEEFQEDSATLTKSSNDDELSFSQKDDRVWEPGGLPAKQYLWDWPDKESKPHIKSHQDEMFLYPRMQVVKYGLEEFKIFDRKRSNKTLNLEDENEQKQVRKLISSWNNRIWEPGGVWTELDKCKGLEKCCKGGTLMRLMQQLFSMWSQGIKSRELDRCVPSNEVVAEQRFIRSLEKLPIISVNPSNGSTTFKAKVLGCEVMLDVLPQRSTSKLTVTDTLFKEKTWLKLKIEMMFINGSLPRPPEGPELNEDFETTSAIGFKSHNALMTELVVLKTHTVNAQSSQSSGDFHVDFVALVAAAIYVILRGKTELLELMQADETITKINSGQAHEWQDTTVSDLAPDCVTVTQLMQSGSSTFQEAHEYLWLTLRVTTTTQSNFFHTEIFMFRWTMHCVKHETQQTGFYLWHRWREKPKNLHAVSELEMLSLVSFKSSKGNGVIGLISETIRVVLLEFISRVVAFGKISLLVLNKSREIADKIVEITKVKQNLENCQGGSLLELLKRHEAIVDMIMVPYNNTKFVNYLSYLVKNFLVSLLRYVQVKVQEGLHLPRGLTKAVTEALVQWKEHPPDQFSRNFNDRYSVYSSLRTRIF